MPYQIATLLAIVADIEPGELNVVQKICKVDGCYQRGLRRRLCTKHFNDKHPQYAADRPSVVRGLRYVVLQPDRGACPGFHSQTPPPPTFFVLVLSADGRLAARVRDSISKKKAQRGRTNSATRATDGSEAPAAAAVVLPTHVGAEPLAADASRLADSTHRPPISIRLSLHDRTNTSGE